MTGVGANAIHIFVRMLVMVDLLRDAKATSLAKVWNGRVQMLFQ